MTTQVAISRRVSRFQLQLRDRQEARRSRGGGDDRPTSMAWGWSLDAALDLELIVSNEKEGERAANEVDRAQAESRYRKELDVVHR